MSAKLLAKCLHTFYEQKVVAVIIITTIITLSTSLTRIRSQGLCLWTW